MNKNKVLTVSLATALSSVMVVGCGSSGSSTGDSKSLQFMFWGSPFEKQIQTQQAAEFSKDNPGVTVTPQIIPSDYQTKLNTLMASGNMPDMSYLGSNQALIWGAQGHILNIAPYVKKDVELQNWLPEAYIYWAPGKYTNLSTLENENLYYNPSIFKKAHISPPPDLESKAWSWSQFVQVAEELTVDSNGKHPNDPGFNPNQIVQYGVNMPIENNYDGWYNYLLSAGGSITNAAGTKYTMNSPAAVDAFQKLHDLIWKYHVMPTPSQSQNLPGTDQALQTGKYAMIMDGQWMLLDFNQEHLSFGIGVLPKIQKPVSFLFSGAQPIYSSTKNPDLAIKFLEFETNPLSQLVTQGLWMPLQKQYYTDPSLVKKWAYNSAHPEPQYQDAVINTVLNYSAPDPGNTLKNFSQIDTVIEQKLDLIWADKEPVQTVLDQIGSQVTPLLEGVYPSH
ncbi:sugar ABC transporter substrate-binding protein [Alicyclobacillus fastidiosus]|nr:sugar ABC transporter substrate-binding protein [Alicyclobacillus fastidiosus]